MQLSPGTFLQHNKFRIIRVLGQGGCGITYLATTARTNKFVAIKEFYPQQLSQRDAATGQVSFTKSADKLKRKFLTEAEKIKSLSHSGIVKVKEMFEANGTAYFVMDYVEGRSLNELVECESINTDEAVSIILEVAKALKHIHSKRMLHLDIKPSNILIRKHDSKPIIIDFGISKTYDTQGLPQTTFLGAYSLGYSSPEQLTGQINEFEPQLDIYSLGATFYTLLTGNTPTYPTPRTVMNLSYDENIPANLIKIVAKAMAYEKKDRYASINDFIKDLQQKEKPAVPAPKKIKTKADKNSQESTKILKKEFQIEKPVINSFHQSGQEKLFVGDEVSVYWNVRNAKTISINNKTVDRRAQKAIVKLTHPGNNLITLKATNSVGETTSSITIYAYASPKIHYFFPSKHYHVAIGERITIEWSVEDATEVRWGRNGEKVPHKGQKVLSFSHGGSFAYTLHASNQFGTETKTIHIIVDGNPTPTVDASLNRTTSTSNKKMEITNTENEEQSIGCLYVIGGIITICWLLSTWFG